MYRASKIILESIIIYFFIFSFSVIAQTNKNLPLSNSEILQIQYNLRVLGYDVGVADGLIGNKTKKSLSLYKKENNIKSEEVFSKEVISALKKESISMQNLLSRKFPRSWNFNENFEQNFNLYQFDLNRLQNCNLKQCSNGYTPIEILSEKDGNKYISITSYEGLLSSVNKKPADRNELGSKPIDQIDLEGVVLWYGFRIKYPSKNYRQNAGGITFNQIKEVTKWKNGSQKINCSKGVVFYMQTRNRSSGVGFLAKGDGINYPAIIKNIKLIDHNWTTYKVGIKFSRKKGESAHSDNPKN